MSSIPSSSFESYLAPNVNCITYDPSTHSRLGDIGYVEKGGRWKKVISILDEIECLKYRMKAIKRTDEIEEYVEKRKHNEFHMPFVTMVDGGNHEILTPDQYDRVASPEARTVLKEATVGVVLKPLPNRVTTTFIAGPHIYVYQLRLPYDVVYAWLDTYKGQINRAARKAMKHYPPKDRHSSLYLALQEYRTDSWKTIYIRSGASPTPVTLAWITRKDMKGLWSVIQVPGSRSVISGGMGSYPNGTTWVVGCEGIPAQVPSKSISSWFCCCCSGARKSSVDPHQPVSPIKDITEKGGV